MASSYGVAGSFVVLLVWVYYSAQILFLGAEFTKIYTEMFGSRLDAKLAAHTPMSEHEIIDPRTGLPVGRVDEKASIALK